MEPTGLIAHIAILAVPLLAAIVFHEVSHGAVAYLCGDPTAARHGRLTLNPIPHIDPIGSILLPGVLLIAPLVLGTPPFVFGYAKPVPIDPRRFRHPVRDQILVSLAGPGMNLLLAAASAVVLGLLPATDDMASPLRALRLMAATSIQVNCLLAVFNMLPVPPLDGGHVLTAILPARSAKAMRAIESIGIVLVLVVTLNTPVLSTLVNPLVAFFFRLVP
jgi:Zn-dependent protease